MAIKLNNKMIHTTRGRRGIVHSPMAEINVTPFVDVVLVLLIIFIVAAPLLTVGVEINLPETAANSLQQGDEEPLTISVAASGEIEINQTDIPKEELITRLGNIMKERNSDRIFLRGDKDAKYEVIMQIMGALNKAGFRNISLVTDGGGPSFDES